MRRLLLALVVVLLAGGCGNGGTGGGDSNEQATVFAAASLTEVFPQINPDATYNFAGSDDLATQITEGAPADVFAAASPKYPDQLFEDGLVDKPEVFATNKLVLIVPKDNPASIQSVDDLHNPDVKLVIGAEGVPIGDYTRTVLENMGASDVLDQVVSEEDDVKGVVGKVSLGEADAGFVYVTDVKPVEDKVTAIELPAEAQAEGAVRDRGREGRAAPRRGARVRRAGARRRRSGQAAGRRLRASVRRPFEVVLAVSTGLILAFLLLPILALFLRIPPEDLLSQLTSEVAVDALIVSVKTSVIAHAVVLLLGTPTAYLVATRRFRGARSCSR